MAGVALLSQGVCVGVPPGQVAPKRMEETEVVFRSGDLQPQTQDFILHPLNGPQTSFNTAAGFSLVWKCETAAATVSV